MFTIEEGSEAFATLKYMMGLPDTRKITLAVRLNADDVTMVSFKRNEHMWTLPQHIERRPREESEATS